MSNRIFRFKKKYFCLGAPKMKCKKCGRKLRPDAKICIFCERPVYHKNEKIVKEKRYVVIKG